MIHLLVVCLGMVMTVSSFPVGARTDRFTDQSAILLQTMAGVVKQQLRDSSQKTAHRDKKTQIDDTIDAIDGLIEGQKRRLQTAKNKQDRDAIIQETKHRLVLKSAYAWSSRYSVREKLKKSMPSSSLEEVVDTVVGQLRRGDRVMLQIKTSDRHQVVKQALHIYDPSVRVKQLFADNQYRYHEVRFRADSLIATELLGGVEEGVLPETILGYAVIQPEVYTIDQISLAGEQLSLLRGIQRRQAPAYPVGSPTGQPIHVGVIDTGIDPTHPDLTNALSTTIPGYDFVNDDADPMDDHQHGTHVAGTIAGQINGAGVVGVNPSVKLVPLKICTKTGYCPSYAITQALSYAAAQGIDVINMSLGGAGVVDNNPTCAAIAYATSQGSTVVVAAGNAGVSASTFIPAACPGTITVGAVDNSVKRAGFSNFGPVVDIAAPGVGIYSTMPGGKRGFLDGTSMATPHISAVVSAIRAVRGAMSTDELITLLQAHTLPVSTESTKPIGGFLDFPSLMQTLGVVPQSVSCGGGGGCRGYQEGAALGTVGEQPLEQVTIQSNTTPLVQDGVTVNYSAVMLAPGQSLRITITGGRRGYAFAKGAEFFGYGNRTNTTVSSPSGGYSTTTTIELLGLQPGATELIITDSYTRKQLRLPITIVDQTKRLKIGETDFIRSKSFTSLGTPTFSGAGQLIYETGSDGFYKVYKARKSGIIDMLMPISNKYEKKSQIIRYRYEISADPLLASTSLIRLQAGKVTNISFNGGAPGYTIKKGTPNISFRSREGDVTLASASSGAGEGGIILAEPLVDESCDESVGCLLGEGAEETVLPREDDQSVELGSVTMVELFDTPDETVAIANTLHTLGIRGMIPGFSTVELTDLDGSVLSIPVIVDPADIRMKIGQQIGWYYLPNDYSYEIRSVTSSQPSIVPVTYSSRTYIATAKAPGYATLTFSIYNRREQRNQTMQFNVIAGSPDPLVFSGPQTTVPVGSTIELQIEGGMGPYKITKSNENVGLGFGSEVIPITIAGGYKAVSNVQIFQGRDTEPTASLTTMSEMIETDPDGIIIDLIDPAERSGTDNTDLQGLPIAATPLAVEGKWTIRVLGLQSGATTITVIDADGKKQELTITVTPKTLILDALDLKTMVATQLTHPGRREIKRMTSTTTGIKPWKNGSVAYARALYQATGSLTIEIFNRHETKKQYLTYETIAIGPTYEQYMTARAEARARAAANQGKRSSITPSDLIRAGLDPCYSVRSCQRYSENTTITILEETDTLIGKLVKFTVSGGGSTYRLRTDQYVHIFDDGVPLAMNDGNVDDGIYEILDTYIDDNETIMPASVSVETILPINKTVTALISFESNGVLEVFNDATKKNAVIEKKYERKIFNFTKGYSFTLGAHASYTISSTNNTIVQVARDNGKNVYKFTMLNPGDAQLVVTYTDSKTGTKTTSRVDLHVFNQGAELPNPGQIEVIEKTVYIEQGVYYELEFLDDQVYELSGSIDISFFDFGDYMYALNGSRVASIKIGGIPVDGKMMRRGLKIYFKDAIVDSAILAISPIGYDGFTAKKIVVKFLQGANATPDNYEFNGLRLKKVGSISIETYLTLLFIGHLEEIKYASDSSTYVWFLSRFGNDGFGNLKFSLYDAGFTKSIDDPVELNNGLHTISVKTEDLGNFLLGFLRESKGILRDGNWFADRIEYLNYKDYYGEIGGLKRGQIDEISDKPWYDAGAAFYNQIKLEENYSQYDGFIKGLTYFVEQTNLATVGAQEKETEEKFELCKETNMTIQKSYSCGCQEMFDLYNYNVDFTVYDFDNEIMIYEEYCKKPQ